MKTNRCFLTFLFICLLACHVALAQTSTPQRHTDLINIAPNADRDIATGARYVNALVTNNWTEVRKLITPGFMQYGPGAPDSANVEKYEQIWQSRYKTHQSREANIFAVTSLQVKEGTLKGDHVLIWLEYNALSVNENKPVHIPVHMALFMNNGKIAAEMTYFDTGYMISQLGWTLTPPQMAKK